MIKLDRTDAGRYFGLGAEHTYTAVRDGRRWFLLIRRVERVAGIEISSAQVVNRDWHDTLTLATATARAFEDLGEDYQQHEHGGRERATEAVLRAYETAA